MNAPAPVRSRRNSAAATAELAITAVPLSAAA